MIAIDLGVWHPIHHDHCTSKTIALQVLQVIIADCLALIDHSNPASVIGIVAKEYVIFDQRVITVSHRQSAARLVKHIADILIPACFIRDYFQLAITAIEEIVFHDGVGFG